MIFFLERIFFKTTFIFVTIFITTQTSYEKAKTEKKKTSK